jgi:hypothetical protein
MQTIFWDTKPRNLQKVNRYFGRKISPRSTESKKLQSKIALLITCLFFDPVDGGETFIRNVGWLETDSMEMNPRKYDSLQTHVLINPPSGRNTSKRAMQRSIGALTAIARRIITILLIQERTLLLTNSTEFSPS